MADWPKTERPLLDALMMAARKLPPMTAAQVAAQRKSWVIGEMLLEHPEMTREHAEAVFEKVKNHG